MDMETILDKVEQNELLGFGYVFVDFPGDFVVSELKEMGFDVFKRDTGDVCVVWGTVDENSVDNPSNV